MTAHGGLIKVTVTALKKKEPVAEGAANPAEKKEFFLIIDC
jgi:hypothetical protein